jgi:hypothetical protein
MQKIWTFLGEVFGRAPLLQPATVGFSVEEGRHQLRGAPLLQPATAESPPPSPPFESPPAPPLSREEKDGFGRGRSPRSGCNPRVLSSVSKNRSNRGVSGKTGRVRKPAWFNRTHFRRRPVFNPRGPNTVVSTQIPAQYRAGWG